MVCPASGGASLAFWSSQPEGGLNVLPTSSHRFGLASCQLIAVSGGSISSRLDSPVPRAASEPRCVGHGDGAGGTAVVGLDSNAGLINTPTHGCSQQAPTWPADAADLLHGVELLMQLV
jgi:hypothetical protein